MKTATFPLRLFAYNIDLLLVMIITVPFSYLVKDNQLFYFLEFLMVIGYHVGFECSGWQATPGKRYVDLKVVNINGHRMGVFQAMLRIITKFISLGLAFVGFFMIYFRSDRRGLHDLIARTQVLIRKKNSE